MESMDISTSSGQDLLDSFRDSSSQTCSSPYKSLVTDDFSKTIPNDPLGPPNNLDDDGPLPLIIRQFPYAGIKCDLVRCMIRARRLCLFQTHKWACCMLKPMEKVNSKSQSSGSKLSDLETVICSSHPAYFVIQNAMQRYQYGEAMVYAKQQESVWKDIPVFKFFYYYNKYLHGQSQWIANCEGPLEFAPVTEADMQYIQVIREEIKRELNHHDLDPLMKYLYAVVLRQLGSYEVARKQLVEAIEEEPCLWCFWYELSDCVLTRQDLAEVLPQLKFHWMRDFFLARTYALLNMTEDAHGAYKYLRKTMFSNTSYVLTELAKACFAKREVLESAKLMEKVRAMEPIRLDDMCFYSNVLHARGDKTRLGKLAHELHEIDPFAPETNIAIACYYSLRDQQDRAIEHLSLALRVYPDSTIAWTLLGQEYVGLKNTQHATACYQKIMEINPRDASSLLRLGDIFVGDKKYPMAIFYYQRSAEKSFHDPRPWAVLGDVFLGRGQMQDAAAAFWQSYLDGDKEDGAILKLARVYVNAGDTEKAVVAFEKCVELYEEVTGKSREDTSKSGFLAEVGEAYLFLANHYYSNGRFDLAKQMGIKATAFSATSPSAKAFLQSLLEPGDPGFDLSVLEKTMRSESDVTDVDFSVSENVAAGPSEA